MIQKALSQLRIHQWLLQHIRMYKHINSKPYAQTFPFKHVHYLAQINKSIRKDLYGRVMLRYVVPNKIFNRMKTYKPLHSYPTLTY